MLVAEPLGAATAIVLSLHGSTSRPDRQALLSRMAPLTEQGAVVAFPHGSIPSRRGGSEWNLKQDVGYLDAVVDYLREQFAGAAAPLCVSGMSGGARMACRLGSVGRNRVALIGAVAGLRAPATERLEHPVRVLAFHGTADRINPYGGGATGRWRESVPEAASAWAKANGQPTEPERSTITPALTRLSYGPTDDPGAVTLWVCEGAGHTWPGTRLPGLMRMILGRTSHDVDATAEIWGALSGAATRDSRTDR